MILFCGILCLVFFVSALLATFSVPVVIEKKVSKKVVPFNEGLSKEMQQPRRNPDGICIVCGYEKEAHGWVCIAYFMNMVAGNFRDKIGGMTRALKDIEEGKEVSKLRASILLRGVKEIEEITEAISKA